MTARSGTTLLLLMTAALGGCMAPRMIPPADTTYSYPAASLRLGEMGSVVLHFSVGPDGKVTGPILHDKPLVIEPTGSPRGDLRLIEASEKYLRAATFDARAIQKRQLTASFVFEIKPCGNIAHSRKHDYAITLCRDKPPPVLIPIS